MPDLLASLSDKERKDLVSKVQAPSDARGSSRRVAASGMTPRPRTVPRPENASPNPAVWWVFGGGAVVLVLVVGIVLLNSGGPPPVGELREKPSPSPRGPDEGVRDRAVREALDRVKALPAADLDAQIAAYAEALRMAEGSSYQREARERHDQAVEMRRKAYAREIGTFEERARALLQKEEYGAAIGIFEAIQTLHSGGEWTTQVEARTADIRKSAELAYGPLKDKAILARSKGDDAGVKGVRDRVARWALPDKTADLESALAATAPPAPPAPPVEARPWTPIWDGKSLDFLFGSGEGAWLAEGGCIVHVKDRRPSGQTKRQFTDGEFRIRFEGRQLHHVGFAVRQAEEGYGSVGIDRQQWGAIGDKEHEILVSFWGKDVRATLDGAPWKVDLVGTSFKGALQFNAYGEYFRIKSIEFREPGTADGLAAHWTFDSIEGRKVPDLSPNHNDGELVDGARGAPGRSGGGVMFEARDSFVRIPHQASLDFTGPFTIALWVKLPAMDRPVALVEKWDQTGKDAANGYEFRILGNGRPQFGIAFPGDLPEVVSQKTVAVGDWTHLAGLFDGTSLKVYVNGVLERSAPCAKMPLSTRSPVYIGLSAGGGGNHLVGVLDDVRMYARALSAAEVSTLAQGK